MTDGGKATPSRRDLSGSYHHPDKAVRRLASLAALRFGDVCRFRRAGLFGEFLFAAEHAAQDDAGLGAGEPDDLVVAHDRGHTLLEEVLADAPSFERGLLGRRGDDGVVETEMGAINPKRLRHQRRSRLYRYPNVRGGFAIQVRPGM